MAKARTTKHSGFTLLEILLVVAAIAILAGIVILAINPTKQLGETRNAQRRVDVTTILDAIYQYALDNNGTLPTEISTVGASTSCGTVAASEICQDGGDCTGIVDLGVLFLNQQYIVSVPVDPSGGSAEGTNYFVIKSSNNRVTVCAPEAEQSATISVTR